MTGKTLIERLRRVDKPAIRVYRPDGLTTSNATYINPDGPRAADELERLQALAQAAGYSDVGEALKAIPVKQKALTWALSMLGVVPMDEATLSQFDNARAAWKIGEPA